MMVTSNIPDGIAEVEAANNKIKELESRLEGAMLIFPEGKSTREARFGTD